METDDGISMHNNSVKYEAVYMSMQCKLEVDFNCVK